MQYPRSIYYTETDKTMMRDRWQKGEFLNCIARHFGRSHSSIQGVLEGGRCVWRVAKYYYRTCLTAATISSITL